MKQEGRLLSKVEFIANGTSHRGRSLRCAAAILFGAIALSGCQTVSGESALGPSSNPVTIDSVQRDQYAGLAEQQHPKILATFGGEYSDPKLERTVAKTVGRLVLSSDDPDQTYKITILNSPNVNAFALPGGYLYVTRGLLALANDSAELAAVIAHEMAHVNARHGILRQKREAEAQLTRQVVGDLLANDPRARVEVLRDELRLAQFSRNQELEADAIGIKAMGTAGYDTFASTRFLKSMASFADFRTASDPGQSGLDFLSTHPSTPRRIQLAGGHARRFGAEGSGERDRDSFLSGIDGMMFGDRPEEGYVRGRAFLHPILGIGFSVPQGFVIDNGTSEVTATGPGQLAVRFDAVKVKPSVDLRDYMKSGWVAGLDEASIVPASVAGQPAVRARARAEKWQFYITLIRSGDQVYRLLTAAPQGNASGSSTAARVDASFRFLTQEEKNRLKPLRIRVVTARAGDSVQTMARRMKGTDQPQRLFRILNGLGPGSSISVGQRVKIVTD